MRSLPLVLFSKKSVTEKRLTKINLICNTQGSWIALQNTHPADSCAEQVYQPALAVTNGMCVCSIQRTKAPATEKGWNSMFGSG